MRINCQDHSIGDLYSTSAAVQYQVRPKSPRVIHARGLKFCQGRKFPLFIGLAFCPAASFF
jgi:hypothetical protein